MSALKSPPEEPPCFDNLSPDDVLTKTEEVIAKTAALHDHLVASLNPSSATFENVIRPIIDDDNRSTCRLVAWDSLLSQLSPNQAVRQAARQAEKRLADARTRNLMRRDIAALVFAVYERETTMPSGELDAEDRYLLSVVRGNYLRSGAGLHDDKDREGLRAASAELSDICNAAQDTMIEAEEGIWFTRAELDGVPEALLETMTEDNGRFQATFRRDHVAAISRHATNSNTRRRYTIADWHRLPENVKRLSKAVALRDEIARMLGFEHHAALKMETRMAPSVAFVEARLEDLHARLKPITQARTNRLLEIKRLESTGDESPATELYAWDTAYYSQKMQKKITSANHAPFAEYFEVRHTLREMLTLFRDLFGIDFLPIVTSVWHESVMSYQVWDTPHEGGKFLGYLYVDLFEREGKYRGAHCVGIRPGFVEQDGTKHYPVTALVCCYANPTKSRPSLLQHNQVTTMFHELGHAIHTLVTRTKYAMSRSRDYSEIPSMMLENWTWIPDVLVRIGKHYTTLDDGSDTKGILPLEVAEAVCATRNSNRANIVINHVWPAQFDLAIHTPPTHTAALEMDTTEIWNRIKQRAITTSCGNDPRDWGAGQARFIHMFRHNDAGYFSYPLSMAYAADIFAEAFAADPMSREAGRRWRYEVLEPGASRSEMSILEDFLGRMPTTKAILDELNA